jgi:hypothetical protein
MRDRRFESRHAVSEAVELHWMEAAANAHCTGQLCDLSISGARIQVERPIRVQTPIRFTLQERELRGKVRNCSRHQAEYMLGIEFDPEYQGIVKARSLGSAIRPGQ